MTAKQQLAAEGDQRTLPPQALSTGRPIVLSAEAENQSHRVGGFQSTAGNTGAQKRLPRAEFEPEIAGPSAQGRSGGRRKTRVKSWPWYMFEEKTLHFPDPLFPHLQNGAGGVTKSTCKAVVRT